MHDKHHVSVKLAMYSNDLGRVLLMYYPRRDIYGLPGGHIDKQEAPDFAMARELREELGIDAPELRRADFFRTSRIILGYTAIVPNDFETYPTNPKKEHAEWRTKAEISQMENLSDGYQEFILQHWPVTA
jgi:8-oxo-dGTP pyrophosphatase MutT (NUDIX family)